MNSTSAAEVIIQALWPGPAPPTLEPSPEARAPLLKYASISATRCSRVGSAGSGASPSAAFSEMKLVNTAIARIEKIVFIQRVFRVRPRYSDRLLALFLSPNPDGFLDV